MSTNNSRFDVFYLNSGEDIDALRVEEGLYFGSQQEGEPHGLGIILFSEDDESNRLWFCGEFSHGIKKGVGILHWKAGHRYEGEWKANEPNGYGLLLQADEASIFFGQFHECSRHGVGIMVPLGGEEGQETAAEWSRDSKHGIAFSYSSDGSIDSEFVYDSDHLVKNYVDEASRQLFHRRLCVALGFSKTILNRASMILMHFEPTLNALGLLTSNELDADRSNSESGGDRREVEGYINKLHSKIWIRTTNRYVSDFTYNDGFATYRPEEIEREQGGGSEFFVTAISLLDAKVMEKLTNISATLNVLQNPEKLAVNKEIQDQVRIFEILLAAQRFKPNLFEYEKHLGMKTLDMMNSILEQEFRDKNSSISGSSLQKDRFMVNLSKNQQWKLISSNIQKRFKDISNKERPLAIEMFHKYLSRGSSDDNEMDELLRDLFAEGEKMLALASADSASQILQSLVENEEISVLSKIVVDEIRAALNSTETSRDHCIAEAGRVLKYMTEMTASERLQALYEHVPNSGLTLLLLMNIARSWKNKTNIDCSEAETLEKEVLEQIKELNMEVSLLEKQFKEDAIYGFKTVMNSCQSNRLALHLLLRVFAFGCKHGNPETLPSYCLHTIQMAKLELQLLSGEMAQDFDQFWSSLLSINHFNPIYTLILILYEESMLQSLTEKVFTSDFSNSVVYQNIESNFELDSSLNDVHALVKEGRELLESTDDSDAFNILDSIKSNFENNSVSSAISNYLNSKYQQKETIHLAGTGSGETDKTTAASSKLRPALVQADDEIQLDADVNDELEVSLFVLQMKSLSEEEGWQEEALTSTERANEGAKTGKREQEKEQEQEKKQEMAKATWMEEEQLHLDLRNHIAVPDDIRRSVNGLSNAPRHDKEIERLSLKEASSKLRPALVQADDEIQLDADVNDELEVSLFVLQMKSLREEGWREDVLTSQGVHRKGGEDGPVHRGIVASLVMDQQKTDEEQAQGQEEAEKEGEEDEEVRKEAEVDDANRNERREEVHTAGDSQVREMVDRKAMLHEEGEELDQRQDEDKQDAREEAKETVLEQASMEGYEGAEVVEASFAATNEVTQEGKEQNAMEIVEEGGLENEGEGEPEESDEAEVEQREPQGVEGPAQQVEREEQMHEATEQAIGLAEDTADLEAVAAGQEVSVEAEAVEEREEIKIHAVEAEEVANEEPGAGEEAKLEEGAAKESREEEANEEATGDSTRKEMVEREVVAGERESTVPYLRAKAASTLQCTWRSHVARKQARSLAEQGGGGSAGSATPEASSARGDRAERLRQNESALRVQSAWRCHVAKIELLLRREHRGVSKVKAKVKVRLVSKVCRVKRSKLKRGRKTLSLQYCATSKDFPARRPWLKRYAKNVRASLRALKELYAQMRWRHAEASKLQGWYLRKQQLHESRIKHKEKKAQEEQQSLAHSAAGTIQQAWLSHIARLEFRFMRRLSRCSSNRAADVILAHWKMHRGRAMLQGLRVLRRVNVVKQAILCHAARKRVQERRKQVQAKHVLRLVVKVQCIARKYLAMRRARRRVRAYRVMQRWLNKFALRKVIESLMRVEAGTWIEVYSQQAQHLNKYAAFQETQRRVSNVFPIWWLAHFPMSESRRLDRSAQILESLEAQLRRDQVEVLGGIGSFDDTFATIKAWSDEATSSQVISLDQNDAYDLLIALISFCNAHGSELLFKFSETEKDSSLEVLRETGYQLLRFAEKLSEGPDTFSVGITERLEYRQLTYYNLCRYYVLVNRLDLALKAIRKLREILSGIEVRDHLIDIHCEIWSSYIHSRQEDHSLSIQLLHQSIQKLQLWCSNAEQLSWSSVCSSRHLNQRYRCTASHLAAVCNYNLCIGFLAEKKYDAAMKAVKRSIALAYEESYQQAIFMRRVRHTMMALEEVQRALGILKPDGGKKVIQIASVASSTPSVVFDDHEEKTEEEMKEESLRNFGRWFPPHIALNRAGSPLSLDNEKKVKIKRSKATEEKVFLALRHDLEGKTSKVRILPIISDSNRDNQKLPRNYVLVAAFPCQSFEFLQPRMPDFVNFKLTLQASTVKDGLKAIERARAGIQRMLHKTLWMNQEEILNRARDLAALSLQFSGNIFSACQRSEGPAEDLHVAARCLEISDSILWGMKGFAREEHHEIRAFQSFLHPLVLCCLGQPGHAASLLSRSSGKLLDSNRNAALAGVQLINLCTCLSQIHQHEEAFLVSDKASSLLQDSVKQRRGFEFRALPDAKLVRVPSNVLAALSVCQGGIEGLWVGRELAAARCAKEADEMVRAEGGWFKDVSECIARLQQASMRVTLSSPLLLRKSESSPLSSSSTSRRIAF